ncbi:Gst Glutathione S-transferase [Pyrenophora tritici-repentis]|uniref:Gst, Glutathione S-transferase n=1 Tax=Pyrenophora tritici-repentis TaxID=45151 RepID=A0A2W1H2Q3_9PLEO|nr:Gst Glutathione S-transferase [Pyrenophora tritici-repentis]KAF7450734.1 Gst Glutathione S-transferase [Pyrenophora tritici-repentis]KAF7573375.1 Gst, Glutathione S-transferase [Pyrenophora tritici-repentis]KAI0570249.1 Gst Glutathione S-transferase [Pyrenophora tritici-repentis]KAI0571402.1 Gst Glutathione S-transferase [Pyrenophora tritici-repentis]
MASSNPILFFDIASGPPVRCYAPNPWKTRYALNIKALSYKTKWIELPDVKSTRLAHAVAPVRKLPNDEDFYTLPIIHDSSTDTYIGDSFDIAVYLDEKYPDSGLQLFPKDSIGVHRVFNAHVDALFTRYVVLCCDGMLFNPETAEVSKAEFVRRAGVESWDQLCVEGEARAKILEAFKADLEDFAKLYRFEGPFLEGEKMTYADVIVGAWLQLVRATAQEWGQMCEWQDGRWKKLHEALEQWSEQR